MYTFNSLVLLFILHWTYAVEYNIAPNKVVTTSTNVPGHLATMANDQDLNTYVQVNSGNNLGTWIQFDLKGVYNITKIIIWPTNDETDYYLARVYSFIRLTNNTVYDPNDIFCTYDRPVKGVSNNCNKNNNVVKGRYVLLKKESSFTNDVLKIAEVAILTEDTDILVPITGQVEQSHALNNSTFYDASKAIDGDLYTCIFTAQETVENRNIPGWWRADLGDSYQVSAVNINDFFAIMDQHQYQGFYSVYVDSDAFTKLKLCLLYNQKSTQSSSYFQLKCDSVLTGRYLTVERISSIYRPDALSFCEIQVVAIHKDLAYTLPINYIGVSSTSTTTTTTTTTTTPTTATTASSISAAPITTTTTTTKTLIPSLPTIPLTTSSTTKTPSNSLTAIPTSTTDLKQINLKKVFQNHDYSGQMASFAVDNKPETCSFTAQEDANSRHIGGWWRADLEDIYDVVSLLINNFYSEVMYRGYYDIYLDRDNNTQSNLCRKYDQPTSQLDTYTNITCDSKVTGRFLTISKIPDRYRTDAIALCEVQVFGYSYSQTTIITTTAPKGNSFGTVESNTNTPSNHTGIIVGCVVGIGGAIILAIVAFFLYRRFKDKPFKKPKMSDFSMRRISNVVFRRNQANNDQVGVVNPLIDSNDLPGLLTRQKMKSLNEFKKLPNEKIKPFTIASSEKHWAKNRFKNIFPYDDNYVPLKIEAGDDPDGNFINASFIKGFGDVDRKYIACQGPIPTTIGDMWRLIRQYDITTIVMLTQLEEKTNRKSEKYWPSSVHETMKVDTMSISLVVEETYADYVCRQLMLQDSRFKETPRIVRHLHFLSWSDKKRPDECFPLLAFRKRVNRFQEGSNAPLLVHCSAGVGRTGTYIAIDYLLEEANSENQVSVFQCVTNLRQQRMLMVQTQTQYDFVYDAVIDALKFRNCGIATKDFVDKYQSIINNNVIINQFELLDSIRNFDRPSAGKSGKNANKNRDKAIYAYDHCRPLLPAIYSNRSDYINAVFMDSYREKNAYIVTQHPLSSTVEDFWTLVFEQRVQHIVMLDHEQHMQQLDLPYYWPQGKKKQEFGPYCIDSIAVKEDNLITVRKLSITNTVSGISEPLPITQFSLTRDMWPLEANIPMDKNTFLQLHQNLSNTIGPILFHCADGCTRSSMLVVLLQLVDMMKVESIVHVPLACRYAIHARPQAINNIEQYRYLYSLALECIAKHESHDMQPTIYMNAPNPRSSINYD